MTGIVHIRPDRRREDIALRDHCARMSRVKNMAANSAEPIPALISAIPSQSALVTPAEPRPATPDLHWN